MMRSLDTGFALGALGLALFTAAPGCSSKHDDGAASAGTATAPLTIATVPWNSANADVGMVQAIAEEGTSVFVFGSKGVQTFTSGSLVSTDETIVAWRAAAVVPSADGVSTWMVGVDGTGQLQRLSTSADGAPQNVSDRYGLAAADKVSSVASGAARVAFMLDNGVAVSDGTNLTRYQVPARGIAANGTQIALADMAAVRVFDAGKETDLTLPDAQLVAYDSMGHLVAATSHALYTVTNGALQQVFDAGARTIHQLAGVGAGEAVWLEIDGDLGVWQGGQVALASGGMLAPDARLVGSATSSDVWAISAGQLLRYTVQAAVVGDEGTWNATVQPIYAAICSNCHSAPGTDHYSSNIDLSTYALWNQRRVAVYTRVVTDKGTTMSMPPPNSGFDLTDAQRSAIEAWSKP
jgi:hypothetical protein